MLFCIIEFLDLKGKIPTVFGMEKNRQQFFSPLWNVPFMQAVLFVFEFFGNIVPESVI